MKFTMSWLRDHLDTTASVAEIAETLTDLGLEVEEIVNPADALGEFTIQLDCDVIQADGGTRTASITGAYVALQDAINGLIESVKIKKNPIKSPIAAVSVGIYEGTAVLDLDYAEDSVAETDLNVIMTAKGGFVEDTRFWELGQIWGRVSAYQKRKRPLSWEQRPIIVHLGEMWVLLNDYFIPSCHTKHFARPFVEQIEIKIMIRKPPGLVFQNITLGIELCQLKFQCSLIRLDLNAAKVAKISLNSSKDEVSRQPESCDE